MTDQKVREYTDLLLGAYKGILFNNREFQPGTRGKIQYDFSCPEYPELVEKYDLAGIAGEGVSFERARRLLHHFAPKLTHASWFPNNVKRDTLSLLDYSYGDPEHGLNCLNKSIILVGCCLAVGIYARRVFIMPMSPYDFDNHVVTEIYDEERQKWVFMDPTTDGYFIDEEGTPLSVLEMRERFTRDAFVTHIKSTDEAANMRELREKYQEENAYICKNLFWIQVDSYNGFAAREDRLTFAPVGYSLKENRLAACRYRISHCPKEHQDMLESLYARLKEERDREELAYSDIALLLDPPERGRL